jgi:hypothetical protein|tara:strand:- start:125 stop:328 length:204 start_codon:yes stop_codon:yes gene_type:complete
MQSVKEIVKKVIPKKEDATIRLIVQQDVKANIKYIFQALAELKEKDIDNAFSIGERFFKLIDKRISK